MKAVGIDISKKRFDVALLEDAKVRGKVFDNSPSGHKALLGWLKTRGCGVENTHLCMEATSQYYEALAMVLTQAGYRVSVVNPLQVKAFGESRLSRNKTDKADAQLIAHFCEQQKPQPWRPPAPEERELQRLLARLEAVQDMRVQESNRLYEAQGDSRESVQRMLSALDEELARLERMIGDHIDRHPSLREQAALLKSVPGVGPRLTSYCVAWLRADRFDEVRQATAFVGLSPRNRRSGDSVRAKTRLSKLGHGRLRKMLYLPAMSALRCNPAAVALGKHMKAAGKKGKVIIGAVMRKLVHWIFGVLKSKRPFDPALALAKV
jgi:transposase